MNNFTKTPAKNDIEVINLNIPIDNTEKLKSKLDEGYVIYDIKNDNNITSFILYKDTRLEEKIEKINNLKITLKKNILNTVETLSPIFQNITGKTEEEIKELINSYVPSIESILDLTFENEEFLRDIAEDPMKILGISGKFKSMIDGVNPYNRNFKIDDIQFNMFNNSPHSCHCNGENENGDCCSDSEKDDDNNNHRNDPINDWRRI